MTTPSSNAPFVPDDFTVPSGLETAEFRLEPLGPHHNEADHAAWTSGIEHIRATPGYQGRGWPPPGGMTLAENLADLERHAADFEGRTGFTYTVLAPGTGEPGTGETGAVIGCVYIHPPRDASGTTATAAAHHSEATGNTAGAENAEGSASAEDPDAPEVSADTVGTASGTGPGTAVGVAQVSSWVRADRAELDRPLYEAVSAWLASDWPFTEVRYAAR